MPTYVVKAGYRHGAFNQYGPGDKVQLSEEEARGFLDKLQLVGESQPATDSTSIGVSAGGLLVTPADLQKAKTTATGGQPDPATPPQGDSQPFDVAGATIDEVLAAVKEGKITASDALIAEQQGAKKRATLMAELTKLTDEGKAQG